MFVCADLASVLVCNRKSATASLNLKSVTVGLSRYGILASNNCFETGRFCLPFEPGPGRILQTVNVVKGD